MNILTLFLSLALILSMTGCQNPSDDWQTAYTDFLRKIDTPNDATRDFVVPGNFGIPPLFYLHDIDKSGIPELLLITDDGHWEDAHCHIYTFQDNAVTNIGSITWNWFGNIGTAANSAVGLYSDDSYKGHYGKLYHSFMENGVMVERLVCEYNFQPDPGEKMFAYIYDEKGNRLEVIEGENIEDNPEIEALFSGEWFQFHPIAEEGIQDIAMLL